MLANPIRLDEPLPSAVCAPLGADTAAVLGEAGFSEDEIAALKASGATG